MLLFWWDYAALINFENMYLVPPIPSPCVHTRWQSFANCISQLISTCHSKLDPLIDCIIDICAWTKCELVFAEFLTSLQADTFGQFPGGPNFISHAWQGPRRPHTAGPHPTTTTALIPQSPGV